MSLIVANSLTQSIDEDLRRKIISFINTVINPLHFAPWYFSNFANNEIIPNNSRISWHVSSSLHVYSSWHVSSVQEMSNMFSAQISLVNRFLQFQNNYNADFDGVNEDDHEYEDEYYEDNNEYQYHIQGSADFDYDIEAFLDQEEFDENIFSENRIARKFLNQPENFQSCTICYDETNTNVILHCGHSFHFECIIKWFNTKKSCPFCRTKFSIKTQCEISEISEI